MMQLESHRGADFSPGLKRLWRIHFCLPRPDFNFSNLLCSPRPLSLTEDEPAAPFPVAVFGLVFSALSLRSPRLRGE